MNKPKSRRGRGARSTPAAEADSTPVGEAFAVAAECTVADASTLKSGLAKLLEAASPVTLDVSAVQRIDTAGLQVIASFVRERESQGREVHWHGNAPALTTAAKLLGLTALLKLPTADEEVVAAL